MADSDFATDLTKMVAAELYYLATMQTAREMFAKSYFSLGTAEKIAVDQAVIGHISANYQNITPQLLRTQAGAKEAGFQIPGAAPQGGS